MQVQGSRTWKAVVEYLSWQASNQAALLRHLTAPIVDDLPAVRRTKESFDFQWDRMPDGNWIENRPELTCVPRTKVGVCNIVPPLAG